MEMNNDLYPVDEALDQKEQTIRIHLLNQSNSQRKENVTVKLDEALGEVLKQHGYDVGINPNGPAQFRNKETGDATSEADMTVNELGLKDGSILAMTGDAIVA